MLEANGRRGRTASAVDEAGIFDLLAMNKCKTRRLLEAQYVAEEKSWQGAGKVTNGGRGMPVEAQGARANGTSRPVVSQGEPQRPRHAVDATVRVSTLLAIRYLPRRVWRCASGTHQLSPASPPCLTCEVSPNCPLLASCTPPASASTLVERISSKRSCGKIHSVRQGATQARGCSGQARSVWRQSITTSSLLLLESR